MIRGDCVCVCVCTEMYDWSWMVHVSGPLRPKPGVLVLPSKVDISDTTEHLIKSGYDWFVVAGGQRYLS